MIAEGNLTIASILDVLIRQCQGLPKVIDDPHLDDEPDVDAVVEEDLNPRRGLNINPIIHSFHIPKMMRVLSCFTMSLLIQSHSLLHLVYCS